MCVVGGKQTHDDCSERGETVDVKGTRMKGVVPCGGKGRGKRRMRKREFQKKSMGGTKREGRHLGML